MWCNLTSQSDKKFTHIVQIKQKFTLLENSNETKSILIIN